MQPYQIDIKFIDASGWQELSWYNSGGTRAKKVLQDLSGNEYYFKRSEKKAAKDGKPEKHYKYEFWNEIIAYQLGKNLGLDVLRYDVAIFDGEIGCISPKMTVTDEEQLIEIGRFMTALNSDFLPENYKTRKEYTFQLLADTFDYFKLNEYIPFVFKTLLFDAIIGNTDRHQENWAFIGKTTLLTDALQQVEQTAKKKGFKRLNPFTRFLYRWLIDKKKDELTQDGKIYKLINTKVSKTAPIYDSGSSLARELTDEKVDFLLKKEDELNRYLENGKSELHWENKKLTHYDLIKKLIDSSYNEQIKNASEFLQNWHPDLIGNILDVADKKVPEIWKEYCIPDSRKLLIVKLVTLRLNKLTQLLSDGI